MVIELGYMKIILEVDSNLNGNWIMKNSIPQWNISSQNESLKALITQQHEFKCLHTFKEEIWVADSLSKHSHMITIPQLYYYSKDLPKEVRVYYNYTQECQVSEGKTPTRSHNLPRQCITF